jgi:hypothetical protein
MAAIVNNLQENVSWLEKNLAQAQLSGFSYSLPRAEAQNSPRWMFERNAQF